MTCEVSGDQNIKKEMVDLAVTTESKTRLTNGQPKPIHPGAPQDYEGFVSTDGWPIQPNKIKTLLPY